MRLIDFPYPRINRPKDAKQNERIAESFDLLDSYRDSIKNFIFTDIVLITGENRELVNLSRIQQLVSGALLRSLYLRNGIVDAINARNLVSLFAILKSFVEISAFLAYLYDLIGRNLPYQEMLDKLVILGCGNRGNSQLRVGDVDAVNIATMFDKLEKFHKQICEQTKQEYKEEIFKSFYDVVCNASHPAYDAGNLIDSIDHSNDTWRGLSPEEIRERIVLYFDWYAPAMDVSATAIYLISKSIMSHPRIDSFNKLKNTLYFNE